MQNNDIWILVINAGSTSTKVAVYRGEEPILQESLGHPAEELGVFPDVWDQYAYRKGKILAWLAAKGFSLDRLTVIASRGGTVKPIPGGIYLIEEEMLADMKSKVYGNHATNVGSQIAFDLAVGLSIPAITVDPPVTDEMIPLARYSGLPQIERQSSFHALSQKATARKLAAMLGRPYEALNLVVIHLGGGISVGAHQLGRVIDVNNALDGDGPFSPERAGSLPTGALIALCFSGRYTQAEMMRLICGRGGLVAYLGTTDVPEIEGRILAGDEKAREVLAAMGFQVAKEIGAAAAVLAGRVDAMAFTGNLAKSERLMDGIRDRVSFIAPVYVFAGENEMEALAAAARRFIGGRESPRPYR